MGKILTYLGVEESSQTRDVLDAERLLEGMQTLYATAPQGNKRDNFAVPLAEMTKVFIEKVKGIKPQEIPQEKPQEELPFNEGDKFYIAIRGKDKIYTISRILLDTKQVTISIPSGGDYTYDIEQVKKSFEDGTWIKIVDEEIAQKLASLLAKLNILFRDEKQITNTIIYSTDNNQKVYINYMNDVFDTISNANKDVDNFIKSLSKNEGNKIDFIDALYNLRDETEDFYPDMIVNYMALKGLFDESSKDNFTNLYKANPKRYLNPKLFEFQTSGTASSESTASSSGASQTPKPSKPSKPSASKFKVGDKVKIKKGTRFYMDDNESANPKDMVGKITRIDDGSDVYKFYIKVTWENGRSNSYAPKDLELVSQEQPQEQEFKVGDNFITNDNEDLIFTINAIEPYNISITYFDGLTGNFNPSDFKKGLASGYYKPYTKPQQETDLYFKVGDRFLGKYNNTIYSIESIDKSKNIAIFYVLNKDGVVTSQNDAPLSTIQDYIKRGDWIKYEKDVTKPKRKKRESTLSSSNPEKDKQIKHILDINIDDIDL